MPRAFIRKPRFVLATMQVIPDDAELHRNGPCVMRLPQGSAIAASSATADRPEDLTAALAVVERNADQPIGLADASNVIPAARYETRTIATLDGRQFTMLREIGGAPFTIVPWTELRTREPCGSPARDRPDPRWVRGSA